MVGMNAKQACVIFLAAILFAQKSNAASCGASILYPDNESKDFIVGEESFKYPLRGNVQWDCIAEPPTRNLKPFPLNDGQSIYTYTAYITCIDRKTKLEIGTSMTFFADDSREKARSSHLRIQTSKGLYLLEYSCKDGANGKLWQPRK